ncbi:MAG TPA: aldehyde dehydrogenase family protein [Deltaproteobacteria bacterium]|nr:aldehyde dehydrogenase family protein [Deltaproteobacteria bacterium]
MSKRVAKILVGGRWVEGPHRLEVRNPYDGGLVAETFRAGPELLGEAVDHADGAVAVLRELPSYRRAEVISKVAAALKERGEEVARTIAAEAGKPIRDARTETARAVCTFEIAAAEARRMGGEVLALDVIAGAEKRMGMVRRFPVGAVLGISPFNFPLNLVAHKVAPAMACGAPIIIKPASATPLTALLLGEIVTEAGWPAGGLQVTPCSGADAESHLFGDERIKKLTFTGSAAVGWRLKAASGTKKVTLELGGNAAVIVHGDADLDYAAMRCSTGAFSYAGQICISVQRIYVQRRVFDDFSRRFVGRVRALRLGDPLDESTDVGPMIEAGAAEKTEAWVAEAVEGGARLLAGGKRRGALFEPTILTGTTPEMKVCGEEAFAPVVVLEPYDDFDEALAASNASKYGLQAGVFTRDLVLAHRAYETLEVGGVIINDVPTFRVDNMPYGGVKMSGMGREGVRYAIEEMTEPRLMVLNLS